MTHDAAERERYAQLTREAERLHAGSDRTRHDLQAFGAFLGGLVLPVLCFAANEGAGGITTPAWKGDPQVWWRLSMSPEVHRWLYPVLLWALVAFGAARFGPPRAKRSSWVRAGLAGGVVVSALFVLLLTRILVVLLIAALRAPAELGVAPLLLGLLAAPFLVAPHVVLAVYGAALRRARRNGGEHGAGAEAPARFSWFAPWLMVGLLAAGGLAAVTTLIELHGALPIEPIGGD